MQVWSVLRFDMPNQYDEDTEDVIKCLSSAVYEFVMFFKPFNNNVDCFYPV